MRIRHCLTAASVLTATLGAQPPVPNFVFVMADDLGYSDTSNARTTNGNPSSFFETPAIDQLALEGIAFTDAYTNGPNCAPTRTALLTGQYAQRPTNNVYLVNSLNRGGNNTMLIGPDQGVRLPNGTRQDQLPGAAITIAETLRTAGYVNAHLGKYHVGGSLNDNGPAQQGFAFDASNPTSGNPNGGYHARFSSGRWTFSSGAILDRYAAPYTQVYVDQNIKPFTRGINLSVVDALVGTAKHETDAMVDATIDFMELNKSTPMYVQFHQFAVHTPIGANEARSDLLAKYNGKTSRDDDGDGPENRPYGALIEGLDQSVARLIRYLDSAGDPRNPGHVLADNTVVVFFSDNGGRQTQAYNGPFGGQKGELREGGVRVPMIAWSRNATLVNGGRIERTPVSGIDFYPTFAAYAGADTSALTLDGDSLVDLFAGTGAPDRSSIYWHLPGYLIGGGRNQRPQTALRSERWKLYYDYETAMWRLYDLVADPGERTDVAAQNRTLLERLAIELRCWLVDTNAPMATFRRTTPYADGRTYNAGQPVPLPILPGQGIDRTGRACSSSPCATCLPTVFFGNGNAVIGNQAFSIDSNLLPPGIVAGIALNFGSCAAPGTPVPGLCGPVFVPITPTLVFLPVAVSGTGAPCPGVARAAIGIPSRQDLCGLALSAQVLGLCPNAGGTPGTVSSQCVSFRIFGQ